MTSYYTGIILAEIPTGFASYTGMVIVNNSNYPIRYEVSISNTTLVGVSSSNIEAGANTNTLYISLDKEINDLAVQSVYRLINPSDSGIFYILNNPFIDFSSSPSTGYETAQISISSNSSNGDFDTDIIVDVTGQRIFNNPAPGKISSFYGVKNYSESKSYNVTFYWKVFNVDTYVTGFNLQLSTDSSFSTIVNSYKYQLPLNTSNQKLPSYGSFNGFTNTTYSVNLDNLNLGQDYYARIQGVNAEGETGAFSYPTGFSSNVSTLDKIGISGLYPSPGYNFKQDPEMLYLQRFDDYEEDFDLFKFIVEKNNNSTDFRRYSGVNICLNSSTADLCKYVATSTSNGGLNFIIPNDSNFRYSSNGSSIFTIELELENIAILGKGGDGVKWNVDGTVVDATNGGPALKLDNFSYNAKTLEYRLYKDINSIIYGGPAGGKGWLITDESTSTTNKSTPIKIVGSSISDLYDYNLSEIQNLS